MSYIVTHRYGSDVRDPPLSTLPELLAELDSRLEDIEHTCVSLTHESEWCLSAYRDGLLIFEHLERRGERHMKGVPREKIIDLWKLLAVGDVARVEREPWIAGYG
jgi:hypothetical protein